MRTVGVHDVTSDGDAERIRALADGYVMSFKELIK
jgi:hypothetical protein